MDPKKFILQVEAAWRQRTRTPEGHALTRLHVHIAARLAFAGSGRVSQKAIAYRARCSVRTVQRALARLHALGLLAWTRNVVACRGWRAMVANTYRLGGREIDYRVFHSSAALSPPGRRIVDAPPPADRIAALAALQAARDRRQMQLFGRS